LNTWARTRESIKKAIFVSIVEIYCCFTIKELHVIVLKEYIEFKVMKLSKFLETFL